MPKSQDFNLRVVRLRNEPATNVSSADKTGFGESECFAIKPPIINQIRIYGMDPVENMSSSGEILRSRGGHLKLQSQAN